jgi:hypothetical protein
MRPTKPHTTIALEFYTRPGGIGINVDEQLLQSFFVQAQ